jgi:predicted TIM-barrel fold metal-dependent hydrolase
MRARRVARLGAVRGLRISGAAAPVPVVTELMRYGVVPQSGYGMTETCSHQYTLPDDMPGRRRCQPHPQPWATRQMGGWVVLNVADARADRPAGHFIGRVGGKERLELRHLHRYLTKPHRPCAARAGRRSKVSHLDGRQPVAPGRLISARDIAGSLAEIRHWARSRWAWAVMAYAPAGMPLDHPELEPIWAAAAEHDFAVVLHTFTVMPPYAPGGEDTWENLFLQRSAAHPWCGMRNMAALIGSGVMDRYPGLRIGTLEAGHGWLPFWMARLDEHAKTVKAALPDLQHQPSEYVLSGRYFQSIEIPEGERLTNSVIDLLGEDVLMYASDYPHGESWFPESATTVLGWKMPPERRRKLFWDNAVKLYARCGLD